jgi:hypothetical protein
VGTVFLCVVDPGVGGTRPAIVLEADGRWYVGPGNGLFELVQRRARKTGSWDHRLETGAPLGQLSWARPLRTGRSHACARRTAPGQPRKDGRDRRGWPFLELKLLTNLKHPF